MSSPSQGLCLHTTTLHRKTLTNICVLIWIGTYDPSNQAAKTHTLDSATTEVINTIYIIVLFIFIITTIIIIVIGVTVINFSGSLPEFARAKHYLEY